MKVAIFVPRRADGGYRDRVWGWVKARLEREHPNWPVVEGIHDDGPFNRSAAINAAALAAGDWDVCVVADSDSFVGADQLRAAVELAESSQQMVLAYDRFCYLTQKMSDAVTSGFLGDWWPGVEWTMTGTCSSMVVVPRSIWDEAHGFDEGFVGWGMEDVGASLAFQTFGGGLQRIGGDVWHLWHPTAPHDNNDANVARMKLYEAVAYDRDGMTALIAELRGITPPTQPVKSKPAPRKKAAAKATA